MILPYQTGFLRCNFDLSQGSTFMFFLKLKNLEMNFKNLNLEKNEG